MPSDLFKEIGQSIDDAREERVKELRKFHIGDVVYPLLQRWEPLVWGTVKDVSPATRKITVDIAGTEKQFDPEDLVLTSPELKAPNRYNEERQKELEKIGDKVDKAFKASRSLRLASALEADKDYVHDPEHKKKPEGGGWHETEKGWSRKEKGDGQKEQKPAQPVKDKAGEKYRALYEKYKKEDQETGHTIRLTDYTKSQFAQNPETPWDILDELSHEKSETVTRNVALNPNTDSKTLENMFYSGISRGYAVQNPNIPSHCLSSAISSGKESLVISAFKNPKITPDDLRKYAASKSNSMKYCVAKSRKCPPDVLDELSRSKEAYVRGAVADNLSTSPETLASLADDQDVEVLIPLANNPNTPLDVLKNKLLNPAVKKSKNGFSAWDVHETAERNIRNRTEQKPAEQKSNRPSVKQKLDESEKKKLDDYFEKTWRYPNTHKYRMAMAENSGTPNEIIELLARSANNEPDLRREIAGRKGLSDWIMEDLAEDKNENVRAELAGNKHVSKNAVLKLMKDPSPNVGKALRGNPTAWAYSENRGDRLAAARHTDAVEEVLDELSHDEFFDVRRAVAENFGTSPETLDRMIGEDMDGSPIKIAVAGNPQASSQTLDKLAGNDNYLVRLGVAGNSKASPSALMKLGRDKVRNVADAAKENWKKHHQEFYKEHDQALEAANGDVGKQKEIVSEYLDAPALPAEAFRKFDKILSDKNMDAGSKKDRDLLQKFYAHPDHDPEDLETAYEGVVNSMVSEDEYPWRDFDQNVLLKTIHDNPACYPSVKERIGKVMTARNPKMAPDVLADLSQDEEGAVRFLVAGNKRTPSSVLTMMAAGEGGSPLQQGIRARAKSTLDQLKKKKTPSAELKKAAAAGDDASLKALKDRKKLRKDFCMIELEDEETYEQMKGYKKAIGEKQGHGRSPEQVKQDFIKNMDPSKYGSPEAFQAAKKRIQEMPVKKFDALLGIIYNKDEEETEE